MSDEKAHPFDGALRLVGENGRFTGQTSSAYRNMVGPFGGITAAAMLKAICLHPEKQGEPMSLTVNFVAPVQDGSFEIEPQIIRTGRSTQHWLVTMRQGEEVVTSATAVFAKRHETWGTTERPFPSFPPDAKPFHAAMMPPWTQNYRFRFIDDMVNRLAADPPSSKTLQTIQDKPPRPLDFLSLTAMCDVFIPRILLYRGQLVPLGTVTYTVYFHTSAATLAAHGSEELIGEARANVFYNRYYDQSAEVWTPTGTLLATTTQMVYFKA